MCILDEVEMDSYRVEKKSVVKIALSDEVAEIKTSPTDTGGRNP